MAKKKKKVTSKVGATAITGTSTKAKETSTKQEKKTKASFKISKEPYDVAVPESFNFKDYKSLKKKNFKTDALYFLHRAEEMGFKQLAFVKKAEEAKKLGSSSEQRKKKQFIKLTEKMNELKQQLEAQGVNVKAVLQAAATKEG